MPKDIAPRIAVDPKVRFGKPVLRGTRVPIELVIAKLAGGVGIEEVAQEYEIAVEDVRSALSHAASVLEREEVQEIAILDPRPYRDQG